MAAVQCSFVASHKWSLNFSMSGTVAYSSVSPMVPSPGSSAASPASSKWSKVGEVQCHSLSSEGTHRALADESSLALQVTSATLVLYHFGAHHMCCFFRLHTLQNVSFLFTWPHFKLYWLKWVCKSWLGAFRVAHQGSFLSQKPLWNQFFPSTIPYIVCPF